MWGDCKGYSQYALNEIVFCRPQILFLLKGDVEFDHDDAAGSRRVKPHASFVAVSDLWAEFDYRMVRTGRDGETLRHEVAILNVYSVIRLSQSARDALNYVAGRKRKLDSYAHWLANRNHRKRVDLPLKNGL